MDIPHIHLKIYLPEWGLPFLIGFWTYRGSALSTKDWFIQKLCRGKAYLCAFIIRWIEMDRNEKATHPRGFFNKTTIFGKYAPLFKILFSSYTDTLKSGKGHGFWTCCCIFYIHQQIYSEEPFIFIESEWIVVSTVSRHWKKWTFFKVCVPVNPLNIIFYTKTHMVYRYRSCCVTCHFPES